MYVCACVYIVMREEEGNSLGISNKRHEKGIIDKNGILELGKGKRIQRGIHIV